MNAEEPSVGLSRIRLIGELMNNSFARARRAWSDRDIAAYQQLARLQVGLGADYLTLNLDATQALTVRREEMLAFLPELVPALQDAVAVPISFDNPGVDYHQVALAHYDAAIGGAPILNSVAASRPDLEAMLDLIQAHDTLAIAMASERFADGGSAQCLTPEEVHGAALTLVEMLRRRAGRRNDQIIVDTGLPPVGADTYGLVNTGLDAMRLIRRDQELEGVHLSVGLSNFSWGLPGDKKAAIERAYLTLATEAGLDMALGNPEKRPQPLPWDDPMVGQLRRALEAGRPGAGETQEDAGFRQAEALMAMLTEVA
jgi:cobalamin-dependent methionine synthase I